jgi:hypothetical protein
MRRTVTVLALLVAAAGAAHAQRRDDQPYSLLGLSLGGLTGDLNVHQYGIEFLQVEPNRISGRVYVGALGLRGGKVWAETEIGPAFDLRVAPELSLVPSVGVNGAFGSGATAWGLQAALGVTYQVGPDFAVRGQLGRRWWRAYGSWVGLTQWTLGLSYRLP